MTVPASKLVAPSYTENTRNPSTTDCSTRSVVQTAFATTTACLHAMDPPPAIEQAPPAPTNKVIALFGATGNTGKKFLPAALEAGYYVKALLRNPAKVELEDEKLTKVKGDLGNEADIGSLIEGADIVVCLANVPTGTKKGSSMDGWMPKVMNTIIQKMKENKVRRLLFQVGGFTRLQGEDPVPCCIKCLIQDCFLGWYLGEALILKENQIIADILQGESSNIDWTLARPGMLTDGASKGVVESTYDGADGTVDFTDLAKWEVQLLSQDDTIHRAPYPGYSKK